MPRPPSFDDEFFDDDDWFNSGPFGTFFGDASRPRSRSESSRRDDRHRRPDPFDDFADIFRDALPPFDVPEFMRRSPDPSHHHRPEPVRRHRSPPPARRHRSPAPARRHRSPLPARRHHSPPPRELPHRPREPEGIYRLPSPPPRPLRPSPPRRPAPGSPAPLRFQRIQEIRERPHSAYARGMLEWMAFKVYPIMKRRGLRIPLLAEFYPGGNQRNTLGQNTTYGLESVKIEIRLRKFENPNEFYSKGFLMENLLHELAHCYQGGHGRRFKRHFLDLKDEYIELYGRPQGMLPAGVGGDATTVTE